MSAPKLLPAGRSVLFRRVLQRQESLARLEAEMVDLQRRISYERECFADLLARFRRLTGSERDTECALCGKPFRSPQVMKLRSDGAYIHRRPCTMWPATYIPRTEIR